MLRDLFDFHTSVGTIHNRLETASASAAKINQSQDLSAIEVGLHDEIFHGSKPVLVGIDASSTYCYLLEAAEHRDADTWGYHLLNAANQDSIQHTPLPMLAQACVQAKRKPLETSLVMVMYSTSSINVRPSLTASIEKQWGRSLDAKS